MNKIITYIREHRRQALDELFELLRMPTVSTETQHVPDMARCAESIAKHLQRIGMKTVEVMPTGGHPVVYADWLLAPNAPTVLIYGHYDVQPADPLDLWTTPPFEPTVRDGRIYARGACDDKGQIFAHVKAVETFLTQTGKLPVNVKFLIEGEEEIGSKHLHNFVKEQAKRLAADVIIISDNNMQQPGVPTICYGTRGLVHCQIDLQAFAKDLHSGGYGGMVDNPIRALAEMIDALKDRYGRITIPGFYDDVVQITPAEKAQFDALGVDDAEIQKETGAPAVFGEQGYTLLEQNWARPALDMNGIFGGFTGEGSKTVIPAKAMAKFTIRLVPNQDPEKILQATKEYIQRLTPPTAKVTFTGGVGGKPYITPLEHPVISHVSRVLKREFGRDPLFVRTGGSIGVVSSFDEVLHIPCVMVALSQPEGNEHSPNEYLDEDTFYMGIEISAHILNELQTWKPAR